MEKYNDNLSEFLVDWDHEGKRSAAWSVQEFERGVNQPKTPCLNLKIGTDHGGTIVFAITVSSSRQVANPRRLICTMTHLPLLSISPRVLNEFPHHVFFRSEVPPAYTILLEPGEGSTKS